MAIVVGTRGQKVCLGALDISPIVRGYRIEGRVGSLQRVTLELVVGAELAEDGSLYLVVPPNVRFTHVDRQGAPGRELRVREDGNVG